MDQFTEEEKKRLIRLIEQADDISTLVDEDKKMKWLFALIRRSAAVIVALIGGLILVWDQFKTLVRAAIGQ